MKILIVRHGEPDYTIDSLTEKGWKEAEYLSERLSKLDIKSFYVSPLGRAKDTAQATLEKMQRTAITCDWLREFSPRIFRPDKGENSITWDWLPQDWTKEDKFFGYNAWFQQEYMINGDVKKEYDWITSSFDQLLASHGYIRQGKLYQAQKANNDTIVFFCHFGVECVLIAHLLSISPMVLWHGLCAAPSSVTTLVTEERRQGVASFRMGSFGDVSHLYANDEEPSFAARFCECYDNENERRDDY